MRLRHVADFRMKTKTTKVVFGHSYPECAFNDSLINDFTNYAASGESYFYTYLKAKQVLNQNSQIQTVFLEFTNFQVNGIVDEWIWADNHLSSRFYKYAPFMAVNDYKIIVLKNWRGFLKYLLISTKKNLKALMRSRIDQYDKIGGYRFLQQTNTKNGVAPEIEEASVRLNEDKGISENTIYYLSKLINYCNEKGIKVLLIRSPFKKKGITPDNEKLFNSILSHNFEGVEFIDFSNYPLETSDFYDKVHLNYKGARKFSTWFNDLLNQGLLNKTHKQAFIDAQLKQL